MDLTSLWFPLAVTLLCLAASAAIARFDPWYRGHLESLGRGRYHAIDGLRGFLAIGVFFTHVMGPTATTPRAGGSRASRRCTR
jgi:hypothetical protein